jgi:hypothetical protein
MKTVDPSIRFLLDPTLVLAAICTSTGDKPPDGRVARWCDYTFGNKFPSSPGVLSPQSLVSDVTDCPRWVLSLRWTADGLCCGYKKARAFETTLQGRESLSSTVTGPRPVIGPCPRTRDHSRGRHFLVSFGLAADAGPPTQARSGSFGAVWASSKGKTSRALSLASRDCQPRDGRLHPRWQSPCPSSQKYMVFTACQLLESRPT